MDEMANAKRGETLRRLRPKTALAGPRAAGIVLVDSSFKPVYANEEALEILSYPENGRKTGSPDASLNKRIRSLFPDDALSRTTALTGLVSGRRRYLFRTFSLQSATNNGSPTATAILIERNQRPSVDTSQFAEQFHLTPREREAVEFLVRGLTSREIASRMSISPNTVKALLRFVMIKAGVSNRSGIIGKILQPPS